MDPSDLTGLTLVGIISLAILLAAVDTGFSIVAALARGVFSGAYVLEYLRTHIAQRVFVITALATLGNGVPFLGLPSLPACTLAAQVTLGLYLVETIASLRSTQQGTSKPPAEAVAPKKGG
jgi:hypothetical protein